MNSNNCIYRERAFWAGGEALWTVRDRELRLYTGPSVPGISRGSSGIKSHEKVPLCQRAEKQLIWSGLPIKAQRGGSACVWEWAPPGGMTQRLVGLLERR